MALSISRPGQLNSLIAGRGLVRADRAADLPSDRARPLPRVPGPAGVPGVIRPGLSTAVPRPDQRAPHGPHRWVGLHLENAYVRLLMLPELGGRIQLAMDKRTGYPTVLRQPGDQAGPGGSGRTVAGRWRRVQLAAASPSGDVPTDGLGDRRVRRHRLVLRPRPVRPDEGHARGPAAARLDRDRAPVRLFNRDEPQTFLWWANVAAEVHDDYQSFFPADVTIVADHAKRAVTTFPARYHPLLRGRLPEPASPTSRHRQSFVVPGDRLDWPRNIPVPTSYMCVGSRGDFFGGYDHRAGAGFVHWADRHYAVGKKQWTWGDDAFGRTWNRNLSDEDAVYIELMAGVFTDNQPDFSHLAPGETKTLLPALVPDRRHRRRRGQHPELALGGGLATGGRCCASTPPVTLGAIGACRTRSPEYHGVHSSTPELGPDRRAAVVIETGAPVDGRLSSHGPDTADLARRGSDQRQPARAWSLPGSRRRRPRSPPSRSCT